IFHSNLSPSSLIKNIKVRIPFSGNPHLFDKKYESGDALQWHPLCCATTSRQSVFAALRHDVLKRFKGTSLYKRERDALIKIKDLPLYPSHRPLRFPGLAQAVYTALGNIVIALHDMRNGGV